MELRTVCLVMSTALPAAAQPWVEYDALSGTLPQGQCFVETQDTFPITSLSAEVVGGDLHFSTTHLPATGAQGGAFYWSRDDVLVDFAAGFVMEARLRIQESGYTVSGGQTWPRPGFTLAAYERNGRFIWIGLGSERVFLSNTAFGAFGSANTVDMEFDTTSQHHVYRVEVTSTGATLLIDGSPQLSLGSLGPVEATYENGFVYFGEPTYWANSEVFLSWFRFGGSAPSCCPADLSTSSDPNDPGYGVPDGSVDSSDFFFYLDHFAVGSLAVADLSGSSDPNDPAYGIPDGFVDASDFFYYLDLFVRGCT